MYYRLKHLTSIPHNFHLIINRNAFPISDIQRPNLLKLWLRNWNQDQFLWTSLMFDLIMFKKINDRDYDF